MCGGEEAEAGAVSPGRAKDAASRACRGVRHVFGDSGAARVSSAGGGEGNQPVAIPRDDDGDVGVDGVHGDDCGGEED